MGRERRPEEKEQSSDLRLSKKRYFALSAAKSIFALLLACFVPRENRNTASGRIDSTLPRRCAKLGPRGPTKLSFACAKRADFGLRKKREGKEKKD